MRNSTLAILAGIAVAVLLLAGCAMNQRTVFNTIGSLELTATTSADGYFSWAIANKTTNGVHQVSVAFNDFQSAAKLAAAADQAGTNALAPGNLVIELTDLTSLISNLKK